MNLDPARSKGPLDMEEVTGYARSKNIDILLYVNRSALEMQLDTLLPIYKKWGIAVLSSALYGSEPRMRLGGFMNQL